MKSYHKGNRSNQNHHIYYLLTNGNIIGFEKETTILVLEKILPDGRITCFNSVLTNKPPRDMPKHISDTILSNENETASDPRNTFLYNNQNNLLNQVYICLS